MKNISLFAASLFIGGLLAVALPASASEPFICPDGEIGVNGITDPGVVGTPEVSHQETVVDVPAWDEVVVDVPGTPAYTTPGYFTGSWPHFVWHPPVFHPAIPAVTHTVNHPAVTHEITVIDSPAVMTVPPTYGLVCVPPPPAEAPQASSGDGAMPWCSSPLAPGWNVSLPNGGCSPTTGFGAVAHVFFNAGETVRGILCPWFFGSVQCVI